MELFMLFKMTETVVGLGNQLAVQLGLIETLEMRMAGQLGVLTRSSLDAAIIHLKRAYNCQEESLKMDEVRIARNKLTDAMVKEEDGGRMALAHYLAAQCSLMLGDTENYQRELEAVLEVPRYKGLKEEMGFLDRIHHQRKILLLSFEDRYLWLVIRRGVGKLLGRKISINTLNELFEMDIEISRRNKGEVKINQYLKGIGLENLEADGETAPTSGVETQGSEEAATSTQQTHVEEETHQKRSEPDPLPEPVFAYDPSSLEPADDVALTPAPDPSFSIEFGGSGTPHAFLYQWSKEEADWLMLERREHAQSLSLLEQNPANISAITWIEKVYHSTDRLNEVERFMYMNAMEEYARYRAQYPEGEEPGRAGPLGCRLMFEAGRCALLYNKDPERAMVLFGVAVNYGASPELVHEINIFKFAMLEHLDDPYDYFNEIIQGNLTSAHKSRLYFQFGVALEEVLGDPEHADQMYTFALLLDESNVAATWRRDQSMIATVMLAPRGNHPRLIPLERGAPVIRIDRQFIHVGRGETNDYVLSSASVSRKHAELVKLGGRCCVRDHSSTAGTYVCGERVDGVSRFIEDGDVISFGGVEFVYKETT